MSIVLQSSGGGQITLQEPTTASNFTATLPAATGDVMVSGNMPLFRANKSSGADQTVTANVWTKVNYPTELQDTANCYDTSLSRFTPNVAGYYQVSASIWNGANSLQLRIYKNGGPELNIGSYSENTKTENFVQGSAIVFLNGTGDYIEMYASTTSTAFYVAANLLYFQAVLVRSA
jgi:hypothetical protein